MSEAPKNNRPDADCTLVVLDGTPVGHLTTIEVGQNKVCLTRYVHGTDNRVVPTLIGGFHTVEVFYRNNEGETLWSDCVVGRLRNAGIRIAAGRFEVNEYFEIVADA